MTDAKPPHPWMPLQIFAGRASSGSSRHLCLNFTLRPSPARFSRPQGHADSESVAHPPARILEEKLRMPATAASHETDRDERIAAQRRALPDAPGVYLFRDSRRRVLYVGKAKSVKKRVASHFSSPSTKGAHGMLDEIEHIEFIATQTEAEALLAEQNFIRQYRPRYNVRLRDDKSYPYIAISLDEDFPRVYFT